MKKKILIPIISLLALIATISFWIKQLTKIENFDIFGDIDRDEEEF
jgi:hypothetical protein